MMSRINVITSYLKVAYEKKKRSLPKKEDIFSYKEIADSMWSDVWKKAKEHFNTSFDWENNDSTGQKRVITFTDNSDPDISFDYKFNCDLWSAGGDWESPCYYFKCQIVDGSTSTYDDDKLPFPGPISGHHKAHFILIPPKEGGNTRLLKSDKGKWIAPQNSDTNSKDVPELDPKAAWEWLEKYLEDYIKAYFDNKEKNNMNKQAATLLFLDKVADRLEDMGLIKYAYTLDIMSNTLGQENLLNTYMTTKDEQVKGHLGKLVSEARKSLPPGKKDDPREIDRFMRRAIERISLGPYATPTGPME